MFLDVLRQPLGHAGLLFGVEPHAFFRTAPQRIIRAANPFVVHQIFQFCFVEFMTEVFAQVCDRCRFTEDPLRVAAVGTRVVARQ